jgi:hypothetical protein
MVRIVRQMGVYRLEVGNILAYWKIVAYDQAKRHSHLSAPSIVLLS